MKLFSGNLVRSAERAWFDLHHGAPGWVQQQAIAARFYGQLQQQQQSATKQSSGCRESTNHRR